MKRFQFPLCTCLIFIFFISVGFSSSSNDPRKSDFSLTSTISKKTLNVGETLVVNATFRNLKNSFIKVGHGNDFGVHKIISIHVDLITNFTQYKKGIHLKRYYSLNLLSFK